MGSYGDPIPGAGPALTPLQVVRTMRWLGDLSDAEIVDAIRAAADMDVEVSFPELTASEVAALREQARAVTKSRLRAWKEGRDRQPTWLEVRALIKGLHQVLT